MHLSYEKVWMKLKIHNRFGKIRYVSNLTAPSKSCSPPVSGKMWLGNGFATLLRLLEHNKCTWWPRKHDFCTKYETYRSLERKQKGRSKDQHHQDSFSPNLISGLNRLAVACLPVVLFVLLTVASSCIYGRGTKTSLIRLQGKFEASTVSTVNEFSKETRHYWIVTGEMKSIA